MPVERNKRWHYKSKDANRLRELFATPAEEGGFDPNNYSAVEIQASDPAFAGYPEDRFARNVKNIAEKVKQGINREHIPPDSKCSFILLSCVYMICYY